MCSTLTTLLVMINLMYVASTPPHFPSINSAYEAERMMALHLTDTNVEWVVPKGTGAVVLLLPPGSPTAAKQHFFTFTHAFRSETFDRERRIPMGVLDTARYPRATAFLLGVDYKMPQHPSAVVVKKQNVLGAVSFQDPPTAARELARVVAKKLSMEKVEVTPAGELAGRHVELKSRVFHKNASVALYYGANEKAKARAKEECQVRVSRVCLPPTEPSAFCVVIITCVATAGNRTRLTGSNRPR